MDPLFGQGVFLDGARDRFRSGMRDRAGDLAGSAG
jgi:hypothetical protein